MQDPLDEIRIGEITAAWAKQNHINVNYRAQMTSTNMIAKNEAFNDNTPLKLFITDYQTAGRGRGQNKWQSPPEGSALLSSWCFSLSQAPAPILVCRIGLALYRAAQSTWPFLAWSLKAPNDLYLGSNKVAGILIETVQMGSQNNVIIGLGLNVLAMPEDIEDSTSIVDELPKNVPLLGSDWIGFLDRWLLELTRSLDHDETQGLDSTEQQALLLALNQLPNLNELYTGLSPDGSLTQGKKVISWLSL